MGNIALKQVLKNWGLKCGFLLCFALRFLRLQCVFPAIGYNILLGTKLKCSASRQSLEKLSNDLF